MKHINYFLEGFGFKNFSDFFTSTFGYMYKSEAISMSLLVGYLSAFLKEFFGFPLAVFSAFVILNILEFKTGVDASKKKGNKVESRKMGRMFLKVGTYLMIIWMLNAFQTGLQFPQIGDFEFDPFIVMYWAFLAGVIYQLFKSLLENLVALGYEEANGPLGYLIRKYNKLFADDGISKT